jgi:hypothetical protein
VDFLHHYAVRLCRKRTKRCFRRHFAAGSGGTARLIADFGGRCLRKNAQDLIRRPLETGFR